MFFSGGVRSNALWGRRGDEQRRRNGPGTRRGRLAGTIAVLALVVPIAAAASAPATTDSAKGPVVQQALLEHARATPSATLRVIVQGNGSLKSAGVANTVLRAAGARPGDARVKR